ncbi:MAG: NUDIX domain-containing protein [Chitinivibrionales bacterium]|nr:NUDIX domain-containing protein [Chitinivibrionales bacterium]
MSRSTSVKQTDSAGGIVINRHGEVLIVSQRGNSWSLPKGHLEPGESALDAAIREIAEESGVNSLTMLQDLGCYERYRIGKGGIGENRTEIKKIHLFLFKTTQLELNPQDKKHPEARWVVPRLVADLLTHPKDREFYLSCLQHIAQVA